MQKAAPLNPGAGHDAASATSRVVPFPASGERASRASVCAVLFLDIVEYSRKPVSEQLQTKEQFNAVVAEAIYDVPPDERIVLDTGDGVAISFLGEPEDALFAAMNLAQALSRADDTARIAVRAGINLGPVRLVRDIGNHPNIIGDGINVAQRVMSFAQPGQVLVSRSYYEVVTRICEQYAQLFGYQGSRTDKHVREHELYELVAPSVGTHDLPRRRKRVRAPGAETLTSATQTQASLFANRRLAFAFTGFSIFALGAAALYFATSVPEVRRVERVARSVAVAPQPPSPDPAPRSEPALVVTEPPPQTAPPQAAPAQTEPVVTPPPVSARSTGKPARTRKPNPAPELATAPAPLPALAAAPETQPQVQSEQPATAQPWKPLAPPPAPLPKPETPPSALVLLAISPWGEVFVDGKSAGVSPPLSELELSPGKHRIEVRNAGFKPYQEDLELGSNQTIKIKHKFTQQR